jgi:hypothetical protein
MPEGDQDEDHAADRWAGRVLDFECAAADYRDRRGAGADRS